MKGIDRNRDSGRDGVHENAAALAIFDQNALAELESVAREDRRAAHTAAIRAETDRDTQGCDGHERVVTEPQHHTIPKLRLVTAFGEARVGAIIESGHLTLGGGGFRGEEKRDEHGRGTNHLPTIPPRSRAAHREFQYHDISRRRRPFRAKLENRPCP
jgi:hypothetical protein